MKYIRKSSSNIVGGLILMIIFLGPLGWGYALSQGMVDKPAWFDSAVEFFGGPELIPDMAGLISGLFGVAGIIGALMFLSGLFRRVFRPTLDKQDLRLVNFSLRFGFLFLFAALFIFGSMFALFSVEPQLMTWADPFKTVPMSICAGLAILGIILLISGFRAKKPEMPKYE